MRGGRHPRQGRHAGERKKSHAREKSIVVLLVTPDAPLTDALAEQFAQRGEFALTGAQSAVEALVLARQNAFQAIILDLKRPEHSVKLLQRNGVDCPIVVLADAWNRQAVVDGLEAGASDFLEKPLRVRDLLACLRRQISRRGRSQDMAWPIGRYKFRPWAGALTDTLSGEVLRLTEKESEILSCLCAHRGNACSREELLKSVWGYGSDIATDTLKTHIHRLRRKLETDSLNPRLIITDGEGYRLNR